MASYSSSWRPTTDVAAVAPIAEVLSSKPEDFLGPSALLFSQSTAALKHYLDSLASSTAQLQQKQQLIQNRQKRKRTETASGPSSSKKLQLQEVHINGFNVQQVWEQAQRVLKTSSDVTREHVAIVSPSLGLGDDDASRNSASSSESGDGQHDQEDGSDADIVSELDRDEQSEDASELLDGKDEEEAEDGRDDEEQLESDGSDDLDETDVLKIGKRSPKRSEPTPFVLDRHGLNDGFFSIDEFNKQSLLFEDLDAKRARNDTAGSDEEDVDWEADPFAVGDVNSDVDEDELEEGDFDNEDARLSDEDMDGGLELDEGDARNATYDQFFDPPASERPKKGTRPKEQSKKPDLDTDLDADVERAMADVHRDLFEDEDSEFDDENMDSNKKGDTNLSTHEKARAKITDEIRRLEAANVANKEWTLIGEAKAVDRPLNSLIEEDLDFERVGKPVPVITAEITDDIESLIKQRIVAKEFDDIIRRPPPGVGDYTEAKSKFVLDETKPQQSLAELYEADHLQATDRNYVSKKDEKLQKERDEITQLWNNICSQLDTLSNLHFRPKQPATNIRVVADADTIVMEDVRPSGGDSLSTSGTLAPQEVYAPGDKSRTGEVLTKGGAAIAKDEMSREEKLRHRRREKQKKRKRAMKALKNPASAAAKKQQLVSSLGKGGVKVIGKDGTLTDMRGQKVLASDKPTPQHALKL
ncbi:U3 snoRNP protein [Coccidioides posadasii str. Silveira]|uniref:U3 small nucleolar ribonucleoprotein protein MPP10 n=2 Tax=Coccidioides posadasii TaxID=199306 RepID=E9CVE7_COCPS|nr:conserved hypothetical protein [Coccidioides posadasii str. Silveira]KMM65556.1 U3 small nucleolar ribonucleoprotein Mpp10 [Coccidioides posadasii RMSCC 3488]QVM07480.1 U3 snoRNP protein [Coccidioides posadasii str. Silveira]